MGVHIMNYGDFDRFAGGMREVHLQMEKCE